MPKRPLYNEKWRPEFTDDIYSIIANGGSIRIIANKYDVDRETAWRWLMKDADKYREARDSRVSIRVEGGPGGLYRLFSRCCAIMPFLLAVVVAINRESTRFTAKATENYAENRGTALADEVK